MPADFDGEGAAQHPAPNGGVQPSDDSDSGEEEDEARNDEDGSGDAQMGGDGSAAPRAAALQQYLGEGVGWMEEDDLQTAPAPAEGVLLP